MKTSDDQTPDVFRLRLTPSPAGAPDTKDGPNPSRDEYLRAAAAFYPFVGEYGLQINPEDVDEIVYAVLHHARSTRDLDEIEAAVREQIAEARDATDRLRELYATSISERPWIVWRQDDNGNRYVVSRHRTREQADKVASEFDARGHRQIYWVESAHRPVPATPGPPPPRPVPTHQR